MLASGLVRRRESDLNRETFRMFRPVLLALLLLAASCTLPRPAAAALSDQEELLERATITIKSLRGTRDFADVDQLLPKAHAVLIFPSLLKGAFIFGAEGGKGVLLARTPTGWSNPAFYGLGNVSFGLQIGGQSSEVVFLIMSQQGLEAILDKNVTLGADAGLAVATLGRGVKASTGFDANADIYAFAKAEGLFGGVALNGAGLGAISNWNQEFYRSEQATARNLLLENKFPPDPRADAIRAALR